MEMGFRKAVLKSFNSGDYTATVQLAGSYKTYLEDIAVARNLPASEMALGRKVVVVFFTEYNAKEAVVVGVYT
jgi:alpha-D-ribose 1-methylphosphonate 5-triphosphate synthase subunit PhnI